MPLLEVENLAVAFHRYDGGLTRRTSEVITNLSLEIDPGQVLAIVGSSGSGKSLLAHAILGILPGNAAVSGVMRYDGEVVTAERIARLRGREIALVPQAVTFLDPLMRAGRQVRAAARGADPAAAQREAFARYGLADEVETLFPFQLSGGMARRVLVSTALVSGARLIIADEPTPGLDAPAVRETLKYFREIADAGRAVALITHDIGAALQIADRIAVFYTGTVVENTPAGDFSGDGAALRHPYSRALWRALPRNGFQPIAGSQPLADNLPPGCLFQPRCAMARPECAAARPEARLVRGGMVRCFYAA